MPLIQKILYWFYFLSALASVTGLVMSALGNHARWVAVTTYAGLALLLMTATLITLLK